MTTKAPTKPTAASKTNPPADPPAAEPAPTTPAVVVSADALEAAMRGLFGSDVYDGLTTEERRAKWLSMTGQATKDVRKATKNADRDQETTGALTAVRDAVFGIVRSSNFAMADRYISEVTLRVSFNPDTGVISLSPRPANPIKFKRGKLSDAIRAKLAPVETDDEDGNGDDNGDGEASDAK